MDEVRGQEIGEKGALEAKRLDIIAGLYTGTVAQKTVPMFGHFVMFGL